MFKKLKQKINEEQSPQRNVQSSQQAQMSLGERRSQPSVLHQDVPASPSDRELLAGMIAEPAFLSEYTIFALDHSKRPKAAQVPTANATKGMGCSPRGSVNGDGAASPLQEESQSLAQKLQQRVSSVESLFRGSGRAEGLFRSSSRESLVFSSSWESLTPLGESEVSSNQAFDPPSDIESEAEDIPGNADALSKEHLLHRLHRVEKSLTNYRREYSELVIAYRTVQKEKDKTQAILSQSQDKALRRIGELREELQMDQQAKKHLQEEFDAALEEKDQLISVLQTQVVLMKKRLQAVPLVSSEEEVSQPAVATDMTSDPQSPEQNEGGGGEPGGTVGIEALQKRVCRQESLLQRCREMIRTSKECSTQLSSEKEALQQQLQERLQELEKMKELHTTEKTKLITQLRDAKNLIEQLEQDKGMVIAETKRQMHETLEMKEEEIAQLRSRIQQTVALKEELQEQKEKSEKAAFEELERALGVAQRAEEARRQLQAHMEEQVKQVEQANEEERRSLQQELTRVKQEVITIMKKSADDRIAEMELLHSDALANKDKEISVQINQAVDQYREELLQAVQEKEQQASLALEAEQLQKAALQTEAEARAKELLLELESARTRILELESSFVQCSQQKVTHSDGLSEEQRKRYENEIVALKERHQQELECLKAELTETLSKQYFTTVEQLVQKHKSETEDILKDKEIQFHAHIKDMNQKTLEKLDVKHIELEAMSSELSEMQKCKEQLKEKLAAVEAASLSARQEFEMRLKEEQLKYQTEVEGIKHQKRMVLEEKDKELEEHILRARILEEDSKKVQQGVEAQLKEIEAVRSIAQSEKEALADANAHLKSLKAELEKSKSELKDLEKLLETSHNDCQQKADCLQQKTNENIELQQRVQQLMNDISEKDSSHAETCKAMQEEQNQLRKQMDDNRSSYEIRIESLKKEMDGKLKSQETKMEKVKQKSKEIQERFKKMLHEQEESAKAELDRMDKELQEKDQQLKHKILEMAQASSEGLSSAMSDLEANHKEQLRKLQDLHQHEQEGLLHSWQEKLRQLEEEMQEKHVLSLQGKVKELGNLSQQLLASKEDKEQVVQEVKNLREELAMREVTVHKLQAELREAAVKLESLSKGEDILKKQVETVEKNLNQALTERNLFQDQLSKAEEVSKERLQALSEELEDTCQKLAVLKASRCKEGEDLQRTLEEKLGDLQTKEKVFQIKIGTISKELKQHCQDAQVMLSSFSDDLCNKVEAKVIELQNRVTYNQKKLSHLKNVILTKNDKICTLEREFLQATEENQNFRRSLDQMALQLNVNSENLKALAVEKESLQKDAENNSQVLSEKVVCIEKLDEENKNISEKLNKNILHISNLEGIIEDLKTQLVTSITEKDEAISLLNQQHTEEKQSLKCQMKDVVERADKEKSLALEQVDTLRNKLTEMKKKAESKFAQNHNTIKSLQSKVEHMEREIAEKDEHLQTLTASIDNQSISKSEMDQILSEKEQMVSALTLELETCTRRIHDLEDQLELQTQGREQLVSELKQHHSIKESEKIELIQQLQQAQKQCSQRNDFVQETEEKLQALEIDIQTARRQLESQQEDFEREKTDILKAKEEALKSAEESAAKVAEFKKKAEHKIGLIRKQLNSQVEEKDQTIQDLQEQLKQRQDEREMQMKSLEENGKIMEEVINKLKEEHTNSLQILKDMYKEKLATLHKEASVNNESAAASREREEKALSRLRDLEINLKECEKQNATYQAEISCLKEELLKKATLVQELQETILSLQAQIKEKDTNSIQREACSVEQTYNILGFEPLRSVVMEENDTNMKQIDWKSEKDLLVKEYEMKLQDLNRTLEGKEAQLRAQENVQKRLETDGECLIDCSKGSENDLQKKLMEAEKEKHKIQKDYSQIQKDLRTLRKEHEKELEYLTKEMSEENEKKLKLEMEDMEMKHNSALKQLMREFNTQMALKEKELEASVKETIEKAQSVEAELMESHREEVSQLQKIIAQKDDDLNRTVQRYEQVLQNREEEMGTRVWEVQKELEELQQRSLSDPQSMEEIQVHLAKKTTQLSEARLKEQEYQEKIHTLEDKLRSTYKKTVVTHLGSTYREPSHYSADPLSEPTEFEYMRKVMFEYMMGRETKTMAKVITSMLKFPPDQAQKVLEREDSRVMPWLR
ncbi:golgin subfamily A member 4 isoform X2 [Electrophorus electricus]|uniref:golgin subfamily A member 4 isoform X2 n=1 Tax=Electrophorus electricus TaxID=8005 RepID=UPI0015CFBF98|nr:golgin subfamily A member 4 isoform X2 [Electrophorus electricus]